MRTRVLSEWGSVGQPNKRRPNQFEHQSIRKDASTVSVIDLRYTAGEGVYIYIYIYIYIYYHVICSHDYCSDSILARCTIVSVDHNFFLLGKAL